MGLNGQGRRALVEAGVVGTERRVVVERSMSAVSAERAVYSEGFWLWPCDWAGVNGGGRAVACGGGFMPENVSHAYSPEK